MADSAAGIGFDFIVIAGVGRLFPGSKRCADSSLVLCWDGLQDLGA